MNRNVFVGIAAVLGIAASSFGSGMDIAAIDTYVGKDPSAGIGSPIPNSQAAASQFDNAAASLGALNIINYENLLTGPFTSDFVAPGVLVDLINNTDPAGIAENGWFAGATPNLLGYNTTPGGLKFLGQVPIAEVGTTTVRFTFTTPIQAFGTYITGLEQLNSPLHIQFDDGSAQNIDLLGNPNDEGGAIFFGFTDASRPISQVSMVLTNVTGGVRDIFGIDDTRYVNIPEPATMTLLLVGAAAIRRARRLVDF